MELYFFIIIVLFGLAISDLIVGVSNDAVNFLNSAVGSRVAPRWVIMIIASIGMFVGVMFSSGMMEVARKGIFNPSNFVMSELIIIFLAVMITDIILLDLYNTFGLPTSTTVSIVFELLGAALAVSIIKIKQSGQDMQELINYINTGKALAIIMGILLSIVIAFTVGAIIQFFTRLLFTFDYKKSLKRYGAIWGGLALTFITYFILIKGAKGATFMSDETVAFIKGNTLLILGMSFVVWAVILQLIVLFSNFNILKIIVLIGTGALAMAFAANDLVNFIGVPLAGFHAFKFASVNPTDPLNTNMAALGKAVNTPMLFLLIAGAIMVITLWISKKAQTVTKTEVGLGKQADDGVERFEPSPLSRTIVGMMLNLSNGIAFIIPSSLQKKIGNRFNIVNVTSDNKNGKPAFDLVRASVNLVVASALISFATSLKLPLSTTYVTFMVAMGSSLSDRAWGRESAVYRVAGVLTVIGGWFFTAFMASTVSMLFAVLIYFFHLPAILVLLSLAVFLIVHSYRVHKNREQVEEKSQVVEVEQSPIQFSTALRKQFIEFYEQLLSIFELTFDATFNENRKKLGIALKDSNKLNKEGKRLVTSLIQHMQKAEDNLEFSPKMIWPLRESSRRLRILVEYCHSHVENHHRGLIDEQKGELLEVKAEFVLLMKNGIESLGNSDFKALEQSFVYSDTITQQVAKLKRQQLKSVKKGQVKTRQSLLYLAMIEQTEDIMEQILEFFSGFKDTFSTIK